MVVASVDFRLGGEAAYPASMVDMNYATRWLKVHAADFGATPDALGGLGLSSGGHMVMLSAMRPRDPRYAAIPLEAGAPDTDASLAYVMMGWPVLDPHARYLHARPGQVRSPPIAPQLLRRRGHHARGQPAADPRARRSRRASAGADLPGRRRRRPLRRAPPSVSSKPTARAAGSSSWPSSHTPATATRARAGRMQRAPSTS